MNERIGVDDLYGDAYLQSAEEGRRIAERAARQAYVRWMADDKRPYLEILGEQPVVPQDRAAYFFRKRLLDYLIAKGDLTERADGTLAISGFSADVAADGLEGSPSCEGYVLLAHLPDVVDAILAGTDGFQAIGKKHGMGAALDRWVSAMVEVPVRAPGVIMTARALTRRLESGPCVVFEGGAGVGAVLRQALAIPRFGQLMGNIAEYHFTDISPILLSMGKSWLRAHARDLLPRVRFEVHDLDRTPLHDRPYTQPESADVVILEMVLYDVANLHEVLVAIRKILRPGGLLAFTMAHRQDPATFFPAEMLQCTLHSYFRAKLDPPRRVNYGYLTLDEWRMSLSDAGFSEYHVYPEPERHAEFMFGGIVAFK